jgi:hypothetical protein
LKGNQNLDECGLSGKKKKKEEEEEEDQILNFFM